MKSLFTGLIALGCVLVLRAGEIQDAAREGNLERVRALASASPAAVNARDRGTTALHEAARGGHLTVVKFLVEQGASLNVVDISGATPLRLATGYGRTSVVEFLRQKGAVEKVVVNAPTKAAPAPSVVVPTKLLSETRSLPEGSMTPSSIVGSRTQTPPSLTNAPAVQPKPAGTNAITAANKNVATEMQMQQVIYPIHEAARVGDAEQIKFLLKSFPDLIEATDEKGLTPLHVAAANKQLAAAQALIGFRAKVNARTETGQTPLHLAARASDPRMVDLLLANRADANARDSSDVTPLLAATQPGDKEEFQVADLDKQVRFNVAQHRAAAAQMHQQQLMIARQLIGRGADVNARTRAGATALVQAVRLRNELLADLLLRSGANPNAVDTMGGVAPLHLASGRNLTNIVTLLLKAKATVNVADSRGETPLGYALHEGHRGIVALLKQHGATIGSSRALTTTEQSVVNYFQRTEAALQSASVSDKSRLLLEMTATRSDALKIFPKHGDVAGRVMEEIRRQIKEHKPIADAEQGREIWRVRPEPASLQAQDWINRGWISRDVPVLSLVVDRVGSTSRPGDYCFVNQRWVLLPPLNIIAAQQSAALK